MPHEATWPEAKTKKARRYAWPYFTGWWLRDRLGLFGRFDRQSTSWVEVPRQLAGLAIQVTPDAEHIVREFGIVAGREFCQIERAAIEMAGREVHVGVFYVIHDAVVIGQGIGTLAQGENLFCFFSGRLESNHVFAFCPLGGRLDYWVASSR